MKLRLLKTFPGNNSFFFFLNLFLAWVRKAVKIKEELHLLLTPPLLTF